MYADVQHTSEWNLAYYSNHYWSEYVDTLEIALEVVQNMPRFSNVHHHQDALSGNSFAVSPFETFSLAKV